MTERAQATAEQLEAWARGHNIQRILRLAGFDRSTFYEWMAGSRAMPAWALAPMYQACPDLDGLSHTVGLPELGLILSPAPPALAKDADLFAVGLRLGAAAGATQAELAKALEDRRLTSDERAVVRARVDKLKAEAAQLEAQLNAGGDR